MIHLNSPIADDHCEWSLPFCKAGTFKCVEPKNRYLIRSITFLSHFHDNVTQLSIWSPIPCMMHLHAFQISPHSDKIVMNCDLMFEHILYMSHYRHNFITFLLKWVCQIWHHSYNSVYLSWNCDENVMSGKKWKCILKFLFSTFLHYSYKMLCKEISEINFNLLLWFHTILYCELYSFLTGI